MKTYEAFSKVVLNSSTSLWWKAVHGKCNLSYKHARIVAPLLNTSTDVWQDLKYKGERKQAWDAFREQRA